MATNEPSQISAVPDGHTGGSAKGVDTLFDQVYARLKAMASRRVAVQGSTLPATALVHELYLRLQRVQGLQFESTGQFFAYAARAMRHLLRDRARDHLRLRAGGAWDHVTLKDEDHELAVASAEQALALDDALAALEAGNPRAAQVVELRYFAGLSMEQMSEVLSLNRRTLHRDWRFARAFLHARLNEGI